MTHSHVAETPAQMGHIRNLVPEPKRGAAILFHSQTASVSANIEAMMVSISIVLDKEYDHSQRDHSQAPAQTHPFFLLRLPRLDFVEQGLVARDKHQHHQ